MSKLFDIELERLTGQPSYSGQSVVQPLASGTFFLETFGCQMNDHDSEKVAGVLLSRGYRQWRRGRRFLDPLQHLQHSRESGAESFLAAG